MRINWTTRDSRTHSIRVGTADYTLSNLMGFHHFILLFQCLFAEGGGPWMPAGWMRRWFELLALELETQKVVLPYRYGADDDFAGGETVYIGGEMWVLEVGAGKCSLYQVAHPPNEIRLGGPDTPVAHGLHWLTKWRDLRGDSQLETDHGVIKLSRRKQEFR